jgi:SAM-dependent methyltransferase
MPSEPDKVSQTELQARFWTGEHQTRRRPDHPVVEALYAPRAAFIASLVKVASQASILDIGCGNGFLTCALERHFSRVVGLDSSASMLALNPCRCKCRASAMQLPFANGAFDVVVESHVLHHIAEADREQVLREMMRVARVTAVCYEPNRNNPLVFGFGLLQSHERMALRFSRRYMLRLMRQAGLPETQAHIEAWIAPNLCPVSWLPLGRALDRSPLRRLGMEICCVARIAAAGRE